MLALGYCDAPQVRAALLLCSFLMRKLFLLSIVSCLGFSTESATPPPPATFEDAEFVDVLDDLPKNIEAGNSKKQEKVPYFENGKIVGMRDVTVTRERGKMIKSGQTISKLETTGFRVAAMDHGANNPFGLLPSDVLLEADGDKMTSLSRAQEFLVNSSKYKTVKVLRDGKEIFLTKK